MEYIFGNAIYNGEIVDILKTVGSEHTNLTGQQSIERKYPDNIITDTFKVEEHYLSKEDGEGNCYDWYRISDHYRMMDKFTPAQQDLQDAIEAITPYTETKTAYIGDTEITFYDIPNKGNVTVYLDREYEMERYSDRLVLTFAPLTDITDITISIL